MIENLYIPGLKAHYSEVIASWFIAGGQQYYDPFAEWVDTLPLNAKQHFDILEMFISANQELTRNAEQFIKNYR